MPVCHIQDRKIYINTQRTQTVKICDARNRQGLYEKYYRITPPYVINPDEVTSIISRFAALPELERWLENNRNAIREPQNESGRKESQGSSSENAPQVSSLDDTSREVVNDVDHTLRSYKGEKVVTGLPGLPDTQQYDPDKDPWLAEAIPLVERSIDQLLVDFIKSPYHHRVEHSIHAELYRLLKLHPELARCVTIGDGETETQLVHKEWPETKPREEKQNRRGNFDLAVLTPHLLKDCQNIDVFRNGRIRAPVVIEMGLDYGFKHLDQDVEKLKNSKPTHGYIIHLTRQLPREPDTEALILDIEKRSRIKTAYALVSGTYKAYKRLGDREIKE